MIYSISIAIIFYFDLLTFRLFSGRNFGRIYGLYIGTSAGLWFIGSASQSALKNNGMYRTTEGFINYGFGIEIGPNLGLRKKSLLFKSLFIDFKDRPLK